MTASPAPSPEPSETRAHIEAITARWRELPDPVVMEFRFLAEGKTPHVARFDVLTEAGLSEALAHVEAMNKAKLNAYACPNPIRADATIAPGRGAADEHVAAAFYSWIDCGTPEAAANARNFVGPKYSLVVLTGTTPHNRPHIYWSLAEPCADLAAWRAQQVAMAAHFKSDGAVINPARIMRLAGTVTWPDDRKRAKGYVSEVARLRRPPDGESIAFARLRALFPDVKPPAPASSPVSDDGAFAFDAGADQLSALDRALAAARIEAGEDWHNNIIRLVASYVARGLTDTEIHAITDGFTLAGFSVDQTRREVQTAIDGARRKGWAPETPYAAPEALSFDAAPATGSPDAASLLEWFDDLQPAVSSAYIIKGLLDRGAMSVVYGPSNSGKTFFALDLAFHVAISAPWRGMRCNGGGVLYLAAEGGRGVVNRVVALREETGCADVPLAVRRAGLDLLKSTADLQQIVDLAREVNERAPLAVIVIDTLSRVIAGGDENSAVDMTAFIRNIDKVRELTGAHIMIVHHTGKDAARGARGHSSLRAATDTEIEVQVEEGARAASVTKQRDHEGGQTFAFGLKTVHLGTDEDGDDVTSCVVEAEDAAEFTARAKLRKGIGGNQKIIADAFDIIIGEGMAKPNPGGVGMPPAGAFWAVEMDLLKTVATGKMTSANPRDAWRTAWAGLTDGRGLFCAASGLVWALDRKVK